LGNHSIQFQKLNNPESAHALDFHPYDGNKNDKGTFYQTSKLFYNKDGNMDSIRKRIRMYEKMAKKF